MRMMPVLVSVQNYHCKRGVIVFGQSSLLHALKQFKNYAVKFLHAVKTRKPATTGILRYP